MDELKEFERKRREYQKKVAKSNVNGSYAKKQKKEFDPSNLDGFTGSWSSNSITDVYEAPNPTPAQIERFNEIKSQTGQSALAETPTLQFGQETTHLHQDQPLDYLGRSYMYHATPEIDFDGECYPPTRLMHTWKGHTKGVTCSKLFPRSGHLLLSASQDNTIKVWDVNKDRSCLRTMFGHNKAVKQVSFSGHGNIFASCSFDRSVKTWDTETGVCLFRVEHKTTPHCVVVHPQMEHIVLAGTHDHRILQWDTRSGKIVQEYKEHLEAVNSITFIDNDRRFVSTSDDKSIRVWDYDIPVCIKYIADASMHSMPAAAVHPHEEAIAFQSMNNIIYVYSTHDRLSSTKRRFGGHMVTGLACEPCFSPDGRYIVSGDGTGQIVFWDWHKTRCVKRITGAHTKPIINVHWHPREPNKVISSSWDGDLKMWE